MLADDAGVFDGTEAGGQVLHGAELAFRVRVVVGDMQAAVGRGDSEIAEQEGDWLGCHRRAAVGVDGELARCNPLFAEGFVEELFGERRAFAMGDHPPDDITAEDVQHDIEIEVRPLSGPQ